MSGMNNGGEVTIGIYHSITNLMTNTAVGTGAKAKFNRATGEVMADGKPFKD